ncbi:DUF1127 domain-containing protein [Chthonobacter albigriseus]|uniref:DUF1127 domain-containing protein n=1 Tax=Chthonobacter albigriseus TaxID=1683161 RepID=UPI0015EEE698|nr:DUF1127 domain-containing protein [Chthonobacter albigriseus]
MITTRSTTSRPTIGFATFATVLRGVARALLTRWAIMSNRRRLKGLEELDDYLLTDIGLTRADLRSALTLPGDVDPSLRLAAIIHDRDATIPGCRPRGQRGDGAGLQTLRRTS